MKAPYLECAVAVGVHGFRGVIKVNPLCDTPAFLTAQKRVFLCENNAYTPYEVEKASVQKEQVLLKLRGVDTEEKANSFRGKSLYLSRADLSLPAGSHFIADLIGLPVFHFETEQRLGTLVEVDTSHPQEQYIIRTEKGDFAVPNVPAFIRRVEEEKGVWLMPIEGLLGEET